MEEDTESILEQTNVEKMKDDSRIEEENVRFKDQIEETKREEEVGSEQLGSMDGSKRVDERKQKMKSLLGKKTCFLSFLK